jgi:hypothetical protein
VGDGPSYDDTLKLRKVGKEPFKGVKEERRETMSCPLCNSDEATMERVRQNLENISFLFHFKCSCCAEFGFSENALERLLYDPDLSYISTQKHLISGYSRESAVENRNPPTLTLENLPLIINQAPDNVSEKIDKILLNLSNMTPFPGKEILIIKHLDYPLGYCKNEEEFSYFIKYLMESSLLMRSDTSCYRLTVKAWDRIEALRRSGPSSNQVFVAMNFNKEFDSCYKNAIKRAIEETYYT